MAFGKVSNRGPDPAPTLTDDELEQVSRIAAVNLQWDEPDEVFLGMSDLSPLFSSRGVRPIWKIDGVPVSLLERLRMPKDEDVPGNASIEDGAIIPFPAVFFEADEERTHTDPLADRSESTQRDEEASSNPEAGKASGDTSTEADRKSVV